MSSKNKKLFNSETKVQRLIQKLLANIQLNIQFTKNIILLHQKNLLKNWSIIINVGEGIIYFK